RVSLAAGARVRDPQGRRHDRQAGLERPARQSAGRGAGSRRGRADARARHGRGGAEPASRRVPRDLYRGQCPPADAGDRDRRSDHLPGAGGIGKGRQGDRSGSPARLGSVEARGDGEIRQIAPRRGNRAGAPALRAGPRVSRERPMRVFLGVLLGIFITIAGAYVYDSVTAGPVPATTQVPTGDVNQPIVNWDVVNNGWRIFTDPVRHTWNRLVERT